MNDNLQSILAGVPGGQARDSHAKMLRPLVDRYSSQATATAGLVITATSGKKVPKIGATAFQGVVQGIPVTIAAGTDMPALVGNISAGAYAIYCFFIDTASTVTCVKGLEGTTLAKAKFPQFPEGKALVGYIIVTYASAFTADTTALDTATTVYVSPVGAFDPTYVL